MFEEKKPQPKCFSFGVCGVYRSNYQVGRYMLKQQIVHSVLTETVVAVTIPSF